jgi:hypothetical protein
MTDGEPHAGQEQLSDNETACQAICVDPPRVAEAWPLVAPFIRRAAERDDRSDVTRIVHDLRNGTALLWLAWDGKAVCAAAVTQLNVANRRKFCTITTCGGRELKRWLSLISALERFAIAEGCTSVRIYGRRGWARVLPDYRLHSIVLQKELRHGQQLATDTTDPSDHTALGTDAAGTQLDPVDGRQDGIVSSVDGRRNRSLEHAGGQRGRR